LKKIKLNSKIKIINLTTSNTGGAGNAVVRIGKILNVFSESKIVALKGVSDYQSTIIPNSDPYFFFVKATRYLKHFYFQKISKRFRKKYNFYNYSEKNNYIDPQKLIKYFPFKPDIIIIHYQSHFLNFRTINELQKQLGCKIIFNMLDTAFLTGGCHYSWSCEGFTQHCENCKAIKVKAFKQKAFKNLQQKIKYLKDMDYRINASSSWALDQIKRSKLFDAGKSSLIFYPIDENFFKPYGQKKIGDLDLSNHKVVLVGSQDFKDERKGIKFLMELFEILDSKLTEAQRKELIFLIAGKKNNIPLPIRNLYLGKLSIEKLVHAYGIADVFLCPSVEDNGPMMINEALMCGTPVVSFRVGIGKDLISENTGYLSKKFDSEDLTHGLIKVLFESDLQEMSSYCRDFALSNYSNKKIKNAWEQLIVEYDTIQ